SYLYLERIAALPLRPVRLSKPQICATNRSRRGRTIWPLLRLGNKSLYKRATGCGVGGAKGGGRGECASAKHGPGTVPGDRVTGAGAHTEFRENITTRRYIPEVGAVCPNWARTDLCGGREVTRGPTANIKRPPIPSSAPPKILESGRR